MSNLIKAEILPIADITTIGKVFVASGMFENVKTEAQAIVRILAGQEVGIPPFAAISGIHIIKGKPSMGSGLMASRVKGSGKYDYRVVEHDEKKCSIDFLQNVNGKFEKIGNSTFTIEDAKKAQTQNLDKFSRNMLFARAMSNGVKWYTPDIFAGPVYVPEEMTNITEDVQHEEVKWKATEDQWNEANALIESSTLDDNGRAIASNHLTNVANEADWKKAITGLRKKQPTT